MFPQPSEGKGSLTCDTVGQTDPIDLTLSRVSVSVTGGPTSSVRLNPKVLLLSKSGPEVILGVR